MAAEAVQQEMSEVFGSRAPSATFDLNDADLARLKVSLAGHASADIPSDLIHPLCLAFT